MKTFTLEREQTFAKDRSAIFAFFSDATNLERIAPPWVRFQILTPLPIILAPGLLIDCRIRVRMLPVRWITEITVWEPPYRFVDEQRRGPYRLWRHEHRFEPFAEDGRATTVYDRVQYAVWGGWLVNRLLVAPEIRRIFAYRRDRLRELLGGPAAESSWLRPAPRDGA